MKEEIKRNLLIVNSRDRKSGHSGDFVYSLGDNSLEIEAVSLKSASIPHTYGNINNSNNLVKYSTGTDFVVTLDHEGDLQVNSILQEYVITAGVYTQNSFIEALNDTMGQVLLLSYNSSLGKYEVTTTNNLDVPFVLSDYQYQPARPNLWTALGFVVPLTMSSSPGVTYTATNAPSSPFNVVPTEYFEVAIPEGQYDITTLMPAVATALSVNIAGVIGVTQFTTPPNTGKVQITGSAQTWKFEECDVAHYLGYDPKTMAYALTHIGAHLPDLIGARFLYVASNTLMNGYNAIQKNAEKTSIIAGIPVCSTYGSKDTWEAPYPVIKKYDGSVNISELDIQILDENNIPLDLDNADVVLQFEIWCTVRL
jgi:hypothetical protein